MQYFDYYDYKDVSLINENSKFPLFLLSKDNWNDKGYVTGFRLYLCNSWAELQGNSIFDMGLIKIGKMGMIHDDSKPYLVNEVHTYLPNSPFQYIGDEYFSLGQDITYYANISKIFNQEDREILLLALRDVAYDERAYFDAYAQPVFTAAMMRNISTKTINDQFKRLILENTAEPSEYKLTLQIEKEINNTPFVIDVVPQSLPKTNLHALIGRNGVGKSHFFRALINRLSDVKIDLEVANFFSSISGTEEISSILAIDFSVFDSTMPKKSIDANPQKEKIRYTFIGFPFNSVSNFETNDSDNIEHKKKFDRIIDQCVTAIYNQNFHGQRMDYLGFLNTEFNNLITDMKNDLKKEANYDKALEDEFNRLTIQILKRQSQLDLLIQSLIIIESDPMFANNYVTRWFSKEFEPYREEYFHRLSSGHKIALLMIMEMIFHLEVNSLLIIDEPELHLHPPLLSSLIKAINHLLVVKNAVGIVATHSPVVLQEINSKCTWIINRDGHNVKIKRPEIETFGENLNTLTREVFGLEVENSGYEGLIKDVVNNSDSLKEVFDKFDNQLSDNAKLLAAINWESRDNA